MQLSSSALNMIQQRDRNLQIHTFNVETFSKSHFTKSFLIYHVSSFNGRELHSRREYLMFVINKTSMAIQVMYNFGCWKALIQLYRNESILNRGGEIWKKFLTSFVWSYSVLNLNFWSLFQRKCYAFLTCNYFYLKSSVLTKIWSTLLVFPNLWMSKICSYKNWIFSRFYISKV